MCGFRKIFSQIAMFLSSGIAIAIIVIIALELSNIDVSVSDLNISEASCLLGTDVQEGSLCNYMYSVAGISLLVSFVISLLQCITCNCCGLGDFLDWIVAIFGVVWWAIAGGVLTDGVTDANSAGYPEEGWRNTVYILTWCEVGLFALIVILGVSRLCCCK